MLGTQNFRFLSLQGVCLLTGVPHCIIEKRRGNATAKRTHQGGIMAPLHKPVASLAISSALSLSFSRSVRRPLSTSSCSRIQLFRQTAIPTPRQQIRCSQREHRFWQGLSGSSCATWVQRRADGNLSAESTQQVLQTLRTASNASYNKTGQQRGSHTGCDTQ